MKDTASASAEDTASALLDPLDSLGQVDVLWLAGEHSGDQHAAVVAQELRDLRSDWTQAAVGGPALASAGIPVIHDLTERSVVGLVEVIRHYGYFKRLFDEVVAWIRKKEVRVLVLVDYPGFNLRLAQALHDAGLTRKSGGSLAIYYYISPQIWAWKSHRRFKMADLLDEVGVIFPFEVDTFADTTLPARFVGHPFLDADHAPAVRYAEDGDILLLAGSRLQPVRRIFPALLRAVERARREQLIPSDVPIATIVPNTAVRAVVEKMAAGSPVPLYVHSTGTPVAARAVLTSSGTMSLACALAGIPGAIIYRAHPVTYGIGKHLVKVPFLGIANLILDRAMYPEFIQGAARPGSLARELAACMHPERRAQTVADAAELREQLSVPGNERAADRIARLG